MSTGSRPGDSVFGLPEQRLGSIPGAAAPTPADAARGSGGNERRRGGGRRNREPVDVPAGPNGAGGRKGKRREPHRPTERARGSVQLLLEDRAERRRRLAAVTVILIVLFIVSLFVDGGYATFFDPGEVLACYGLWFQQAILSITEPYNVLSGAELLTEHLAYYRIMNRVGITLMTVVCGAVLAIAGSLYQNAFKNPIAGPSMLGVSSAIQFGDALLVATFGVAAGTMTGARYLVDYACVIVVLVLLFVFGRMMSGRGRPFNIVNLLLIAMIITQLIGVLVTYITTYLFDWEMWEIYNGMSEGLTVLLSPLSWGVLLASCVVGLAPVIALRFRLNGLSFDEADMKLLGIDSTRLRLLALFCGSVLLMAAQVQMGTVAMLSLVVPHVSRMVFGAEFRKQFWGNILIGAALLLLCRIIVGFIPFIGAIIPISIVLNFLVLPFFVWMLAVQQRGWE